MCCLTIDSSDLSCYVVYMFLYVPGLGSGCDYYLRGIFGRFIEGTHGFSGYFKMVCYHALELCIPCVGYFGHLKIPTSCLSICTGSLFSLRDRPASPVVNSTLEMKSKKRKKILGII